MDQEATRTPRARGAVTSRPSVGTLALGALVAGLALGAIPSLHETARTLEPVGTLWVNALRMTVIPLIVSLLIVGVVSAASSKDVGTLGLKAFGLFLLLLAVAGAFTAIIAPFAFRFLPVDPVASATLRAGAHLQPTSADVSFTGWALSLIPANPVKAVADGAMLPILVFTLAFAFALAKLEPNVKQAPLKVFESISQAMLVIVKWVLALAPVGVFALAFALGSKLGSDTAAKALGYYVGLVIVLHVVTGAGVYAFAVLGGGVPLSRFARAVFPAQVVAFTTRSSLAALPAMVEGGRDQLKLPADITGFVIPFAVSAFKLTSPIYWTLGAMVVGRIYGIELAPTQLLTIALASILLNAATPGIPSGGLLIQAPLYAQVGLPVEALGILIAIDTIPDMFKTTLNVTADMGVAVVLGRRSGRAG